MKSRFQRSIVWLILSVCLLAAVPRQTTADPIAAPPAQSGGFELGGQIFTFITVDEMKAAKMGWVKMQLNFSLGSSTADAQNIIDHGRRHGFKVLLSIKGNMSQLAANPTQFYDAYATFVGNVAALSPDAIEIWNEPNLDREWPSGHIGGDNYTQLLKKAYPAIKNRNSAVMVISGAPSPTGFYGGCYRHGCDDKPFIEQMKANGAEPYFDCTGLHYNEGIISPNQNSGDPRGDHYTRYYQGMVTTYRNVFPNKPLCFTELGYLSPEGWGQLPAGYQWASGTSIQEHAQWLGEAVTRSRNEGIVRLMVVWNVDASSFTSDPMAGWAIIRRDDSCPACATLASAMGGTPTNAAPSVNYFTTSTVRLTWSRITWATQYQVQFDTDQGFAAPYQEAITNAQTLEVTTPALSDATYYWRVRAQRSNGTWGAWSSVETFVVNAVP